LWLTFFPWLSASSLCGLLLKDGSGTAPCRGMRLHGFEGFASDHLSLSTNASSGATSELVLNPSTPFARFGSQCPRAQPTYSCPSDWAATILAFLIAEIMSTSICFSPKSALKKRQH
jgi:hypothetical protein